MSEQTDREMLVMLNSPRFRKLVRDRRILGWGFAGILILLYAGATVISVIYPDFLMNRIYSGSYVTAGFLLMNCLIVAAIVFSVFYDRIATRRLDPQTESIRKDLK